MFKPLSQFVMIIAILLSFGLQAMASSAQLMPANAEKAPHSHSANTNEQAEHSSESSDECCDTQCCESDCFCPANTCASVAWLSISANTKAIAASGAAVFHHTKRSLSSLYDTLYRPPIFTS